jgi:hypothetical protein
VRRKEEKKEEEMERREERKEYLELKRDVEGRNPCIQFQVTPSRWVFKKRLPFGIHMCFYLLSNKIITNIFVFLLFSFLHFIIYLFIYLFIVRYYYVEIWHEVDLLGGLGG